MLTRAVGGAVSAGLREGVPFYQSPEFENALVRLARSYLTQHGASWEVPEEYAAELAVEAPVGDDR